MEYIFGAFLYGKSRMDISASSGTRHRDLALFILYPYRHALFPGSAVRKIPDTPLLFLGHLLIYPHNPIIVPIFIIGIIPSRRK